MGIRQLRGHQANINKKWRAWFSFIKCIFNENNIIEIILNRLSKITFVEMVLSSKGHASEDAGPMNHTVDLSPPDIPNREQDISTVSRKEYHSFCW